MAKRKGKHDSDILPKLLTWCHALGCTDYHWQRAVREELVVNKGAWWLLYCKWEGKRVRMSTGAALWLLLIRSTAGCLGQALSQTQAPASALRFVALLISLCTSLCLTGARAKLCTGSDVLSFSSSCCFIGCLTLRSTLSYFLPHVFPKATLVPSASWDPVILLIQCHLCSLQLVHHWVYNWHFVCLLWPG